jgi:hypothetical protein
VVIDHNTFSTPNGAALGWIAALGTGFRFTNNIAYHGQYGLMMDGSHRAIDVLNAAAPGHVFAGNAIVGTDGSYYPAGNSFLTSEQAAAGLRGTDGAPVGADLTKVP